MGLVSGAGDGLCYACARHRESRGVLGGTCRFRQWTAKPGKATNIAACGQYNETTDLSRSQIFTTASAVLKIESNPCRLRYFECCWRHVHNRSREIKGKQSRDNQLLN